MKIALDVMGFENEIGHAIRAARRFQQEHPDVKVVLVGDQGAINSATTPNEFTVVNAPQFVSQDDTIMGARRKPNSSMQICANLLRDGEVDGLVSAGSTPIFVFTMYSTIGLMTGVKKPGFMPTFPSVDGVGFNMLDVGASIEVTPRDLAIFGIMGNEYARHRLTTAPRIGVLNIGTEAHKGRELQREAGAILSKIKDLNYIGFVEPNNLLNRTCDVVVTDGFTGNIALKSMEGAVRTFGKVIRGEYERHLLAGLLSRKIFRRIKERFNYKNYAGALVLGLKKIVVKTHGSADEKQFYSALNVLHACLTNAVLEGIQSALERFFTTYPEYKEE